MLSVRPYHLGRIFVRNSDKRQRRWRALWRIDWPYGQTKGGRTRTGIRISPCKAFHAIPAVVAVKPRREKRPTTSSISGEEAIVSSHARTPRGTVWRLPGVRCFCRPPTAAMAATGLLRRDSRFVKLLYNLSKKDPALLELQFPKRGRLISHSESENEKQYARWWAISAPKCPFGQPLLAAKTRLVPQL